MYNDVQAQDKEVRDANMEALATDIQNYFVEKIWRRRNRKQIGWI